MKRVIVLLWACLSSTLLLANHWTPDNPGTYAYVMGVTSVVEINDVRCTVLYPGMTLSSIAMKYDISKQELLEFNEMASEAGLSEGDIIFLDKKKKKYTGAQDFCRAKAGDTLYAISQRFGIRLASLAKMNGKDLFSGLTEGEKIILK